jgi:hypothetical protein
MPPWLPIHQQTTSFIFKMQTVRTPFCGRGFQVILPINGSGDRSVFKVCFVPIGPDVLLDPSGYWSLSSIGIARNGVVYLIVAEYEVIDAEICRPVPPETFRNFANAQAFESERRGVPPQPVVINKLPVTSITRLTVEHQPDHVTAHVRIYDISEPLLRVQVGHER